MWEELKEISQPELHARMMKMAEAERMITERLLWHLRECEERRMYLDYESGSLHEYCTKWLKYSEGAATRRVNASRMLQYVPSVSEKILDGSVNLSNLSMAQSYVRAEEKRTGKKLSQELKQEIASKIENVSQKQAERALVDMMPEAPVHKDSTVILAFGETEIRFAADAEFMEMYERAREMHSHLDLPMLGLFKHVFKEHLKRHAPKAKPVPAADHDTAEPASTKQIAEIKTSTHSHTAAVWPRVKRKTYYSVETERALDERSGGQCEHVDESGHRCTRRYHLQTDHILPVSKGGTNDLTNLRRLCRPHNLRKGSYLREPQVLYA